MPNDELDMSEVRIYVDEEVHPIYEEMVSQAAKNAENKPFATMKDLFMVAACLGAKHNRYKPLNSRREIFRGTVFKEKTDVPILAALAYQQAQDIEVMSDAKKVVEIVQGWANGGIHLVRDELLYQPGGPLYNLVNMVLD